jgi:hypothetical protein
MKIKYPDRIEFPRVLYHWSSDANLLYSPYSMNMKEEALWHSNTNFANFGPLTISEQTVLDK